MKAILLLIANSLAIFMMVVIGLALFGVYMYLPIDKLFPGNTLAELISRIAITFSTAVFFCSYLLLSYKLIQKLQWKIS